MLKLDHRARMEAAGHIVRNHSHAELTRILAHLPACDVATAIREHLARTDCRARTVQPCIPRHKPQVL